MVFGGPVDPKILSGSCGLQPAYNRVGRAALLGIARLQTSSVTTIL